MTTGEQLTVIDALRRRPFPVRRERSAAGESGPGFHMARLWESAPLWDADPADAREIREDCAAELAALTEVLSLRWGAPGVLDLAPALERTAMGLPVAPPLDLLCGLVPRLHTWRADGRWLALGGGQCGPEQPCQVLVAIAA
ncbi:hypothetical protein [Streptomyces gilvosporeus]|uniref:Uncharacterized protein n=1 Tax=Streptomyces gilvosporeus TaxID=553510 RepID=A0A1V0U1S2_9ACTN|nr:hypothetical protein [Streptomyces gilvosporeus]ARF58968.1 hypothetical protein B1H19_36595 [Streptomyces gilvosporeus]